MANVTVRVNRDFISPMYGDCVAGQSVQMSFAHAMSLQEAGVVTITDTPAIETKPAPEVEVETKPFRQPAGLESKDGGDTGERAEPKRPAAKGRKARSTKG